MIESLLLGFTIAAAFTSAWPWIKASRVPIPPSTSDSWEDKGPFTEALRLQSTLNAQAAMCAASAAAFQGLSLLMRLLVDLLGR
jgi:hypothetical protein